MVVLYSACLKVAGITGGFLGPHAANTPATITKHNANASKDFTQAAEIAAFHSSAVGGQNIAVDYSLAKNIKKPAGAKPGLVIYHTNWTAYVTPHADEIRRLRQK